MKIDNYQMVTDRICALMEQGIKPWAKPWVGAANSAEKAVRMILNIKEVRTDE